MNLVHLRSFYTTVNSKSISKAAKQLHLSQPGLSMQIQSLENELGVNLLTRSRSGVELSPQGEVVFEYAGAMLSLEDNIQRDLKNFEEKNYSLNLGACKSMGDYALPCTLYTFKQIHADINISMDIDTSLGILKKLQERTINLGVIQETSIPDDITAQNMLSDEMILVAGPNYAKGKISLTDIYELPIIVREKGSSSRIILENILRKNKIDVDKLNIIYSFNSPEAIKQSIVSGNGLAFLPNISVRHEIRSGAIKKVLIKDFDATFDYYLAYRKNHSFSETEKTFLKFILSKSRCFCY